MSVWNYITVFNPIDLNKTSQSNCVRCIKNTLHKIYNYGIIFEPFVLHSCWCQLLCTDRLRRHIFMGWGWRSQQRKFISDLVSHLEQVRVTYSYICKFIANLCCVYLAHLAYLHPPSRVHSAAKLGYGLDDATIQYKAAKCILSRKILHESVQFIWDKKYLKSYWAPNLTKALHNYSFKKKRHFINTM